MNVLSLYTSRKIVWQLLLCSTLALSTPGLAQDSDELIAIDPVMVQGDPTKTKQLRSPSKFYRWHWVRYREQEALYEKLLKRELVADEVNVAFLHFDMQTRGEILLDKLLGLTYHPQYEQLRSRIMEVRRYRTWGEWTKRHEE